MMMQKKLYQFITPLNVVRFFAAVAIVVYHFGRWSYPFNTVWAKPFVLLSNTGVTLFFVLSGFIMVHVYGARLSKGIHWREWKLFYMTRIARIVPVYLIALALTIGYVVYAKELWTIKSLILQVLFLQAWFPHESLNLNFTGWSLSVELFFYALFPALILFLSKRTWSWRWGVAGVIWILSNLITVAGLFLFVPTEELSNVFLKFFPLFHLNSFIIGIVAGLWYQETKRSISSLLFVGAIAAIIADATFIPQVYNPIQHNGLLAPLYAIIIVGIAQSKQIVSNVLSRTPFVIGGDASYGIYILQAPVYWWVYKMFTAIGVAEWLGESGRFFVYLGILILVSVLSNRTLERWGKRLIVTGLSQS